MGFIWFYGVFPTGFPVGHGRLLQYIYPGLRMVKFYLYARNVYV